MKILSISDIHNNLAPVLKLRDLEKNDYDAIFVAGDAGEKFTDQIFRCLATFNCPVFNVYGNWDHVLEYDFNSPNFKLVHHNIHEVNGLYISGISGCPTHWGENPIAREFREALSNRHLAILDLLRIEQSKNGSEKRVSR